MPQNLPSKQQDDHKSKRVTVTPRSVEPSPARPSSDILSEQRSEGEGMPPRWENPQQQVTSGTGKKQH